MLLGACSLSEWPEAWAELQRSSAALRRRVVGQKEVAEREMPCFRRHALAVLAGKGRWWWGGCGRRGITGQDVQRGTFAHRHCAPRGVSKEPRGCEVIKDQATGEDWCRLAFHEAIEAPRLPSEPGFGATGALRGPQNVAFPSRLGPLRALQPLAMARDGMPELDPLGSIKFLPVLLIGVVLPRLLGGAAAVAIFLKGDTELYKQNLANLVKVCGPPIG